MRPRKYIVRVSTSCWFTNLDVEKHNQDIVLYKKMEKIYISLDEYLIKRSDRKELIGFFDKIKNKEIIGCDAQAKGGLNWFPIDLIITIIGISAAGFLQEIGKDIYIKLKKKIKYLLFSNQSEKIKYANIAFEISGKVIYFMFEDLMIENSFDAAFEKIFSEYEENAKKIERFIESNPTELFGYFESITMKYDDDEENRWIIGWINKT